jgi:UDP-GlcNAc:undecaprenyl-phosphate/decaprenyl-phosphate GlcNAc-1-phosphate transferase
MRAYLLMMLVAAAVTFVGTWAVLKLAHKYKIYPQIRSRDVHTRPTPRLGGVAMFLGFTAAVLTAGSLGWFKSVFSDPIHIIAIVVAAFLITLLGFLDDLYDLDWSLKLAGQFVVAGILAWQGVQVVSLPIAGLTIGSFGISFVATVFLTVLVMNAVNFIDGLDGLVAGVVLIGTCVFFAYSYLLAQQTSPTNYFNLASLISAIVIGMCVGFLPFNWHRAKIFMGDTGAMLLGLLMATSALTVTGQIDPQLVSRGEQIPAFIPLILPLAILVLPLLDFTWAVLRRLRAGKSPFSADRLHIHHRLQDFGHSHLGAVLVFYAWTAVISMSCLLFFFLPVSTVFSILALGIFGAVIYTIRPVIQRRFANRVKGS